MRRPALRHPWLIFAMLSSACGGDPAAGKGATVEEPVESDADTDADADADADADTDADADADADDTGPPPPEIVRFVAMGDAGEGNSTQYAVADAIGAVCAAKNDTRAGCEFVLYLGDNFYDDGVSSVEDEQFQSKFELPYADLDLPFYAVLGNHDYGVLSILSYKGDYEVEYSDRSDKWNMPDSFYAFDAGPARFIGLNTAGLMVEDIIGNTGQDAWIDGVIGSSTQTWRVAFGHHPYLSNGQHGNAGSYEGYDWLPIANGATVKEFFDGHLCGKIDVYLAGHDHNRQWLEPTCGVELIVSGAAAKTTGLVGRDVPTFFEDDASAGFVWIELQDRRLTGEFYDQNGTLQFTRTFEKPE